MFNNTRICLQINGKSISFVFYKNINQLNKTLMDNVKKKKDGTYEATVAEGDVINGRWRVCYGFDTPLGYRFKLEELPDTELYAGLHGYLYVENLYTRNADFRQASPEEVEEEIKRLITMRDFMRDFMRRRDKTDNFAKNYGGGRPQSLADTLKEELVNTDKLVSDWRRLNLSSLRFDEGEKPTWIDVKEETNGATDAFKNVPYHFAGKVGTEDISGLFESPNESGKIKLGLIEILQLDLLEYYGDLDAVTKLHFERPLGTIGNVLEVTWREYQTRRDAGEQYTYWASVKKRRQAAQVAKCPLRFLYEDGPEPTEYKYTEQPDEAPSLANAVYAAGGISSDIKHGIQIWELQRDLLAVYKGFKHVVSAKYTRCLGTPGNTLVAVWDKYAGRRDLNAIHSAQVQIEFSITLRQKRLIKGLKDDATKAKCCLRFEYLDTPGQFSEFKYEQPIGETLAELNAMGKAYHAKNSDGDDVSMYRLTDIKDFKR